MGLAEVAVEQHIERLGLCDQHRLAPAHVAGLHGLDLPLYLVDDLARAPWVEKGLSPAMSEPAM